MSSTTQHDPSSPGAVAGATFPMARKGFDPASVRDFLRRVSQELGRAQHERDRLERELHEAREAARRAEPENLDEATVAAKLGEEAARVLATAHEAAGQIRARAEETATRMLRDADLEAARMRGDAEVESARRRQEAQDAAEADVESARLEGREMVAEARAVRERVFADLARRRNLARQQIEALHSGRDQILASLQRARGELDASLADLEVHVTDDADEDTEDMTGLHELDTGPTPTVAPTASVVLGEMDVPTAIVDRHVARLEPELVEDAPPVDPEEPPVEDAPPVDTEEPPADEDEHASVNDLFARLRQASSESVARDVLEADDASSDVAPPEAAAAPTTGDEAIALRQAALKPVRTALARQLKRVLADEQNEVLDRLRQRNASLDTDDVLGPANTHPGTYREAAEDQLWVAATAGAHALSDLDGEELHAALEARSVLDRSLDTLEAELVVPLRARLTENLEAAGDASEATSLVRATYREWKGRIDEIGDDLVRTAYGRASYAVLAPGTPVCWVQDPSGPGCPDAEDNVLAGAVPSGEPFPTGHRYAPAYRGCRCLLVTDPG